MSLPVAPPFAPIHRVARSLGALVQRGNQFQLASGEVTSWYVDAKPLIYGTENALLASAIGSLLRKNVLTPEAIGGVGFGGTPLAVLCGFQLGRPAFGVRAEAKYHGLQGRIAGELRSGSTVVLLEDVLTTGNSVLTAIRAVENVGAQVLAVICLLNRSEPLVQELPGQSWPIPVLSLLVPEDIGVSD